jgi:hypothetical protein
MFSLFTEVPDEWPQHLSSHRVVQCNVGVAFGLHRNHSIDEDIPKEWFSGSLTAAS